MDVLRQIELLFGNTFRGGLCAGLLLGLAIGGAGYLLLYSWNRIRRFFAPIRPSLLQGPSPAARLGGCVESALWLALILVALVVLLEVVVIRP